MASSPCLRHVGLELFAQPERLFSFYFLVAFVFQMYPSGLQGWHSNKKKKKTYSRSVATIHCPWPYNPLPEPDHSARGYSAIGWMSQKGLDLTYLCLPGSRHFGSPFSQSLCSRGLSSQGRTHWYHINWVTLKCIQGCCSERFALVCVTFSSICSDFL